MTFHRPSSVTSRFSAAATFGVVAFAAALLSSPLSASAAQSSLPPCALSGGISVVFATTSATGGLSPTCAPQSAQILVIVSNPTQPSSPPLAPSDPNAAVVGPPTNALATPTATPVPFDMALVTSDPRIDTYAKRQAIRDKYRGQIDESTFNDELGDGVPLDQALADGMAALGQKHP